MPLVPRFPVTVTVRNPGPLRTDPRSGNKVEGEFTETVTPAYLSQQAVSVLSSAIELRGNQNTVMSNHTLLLPAGVEVKPNAEIVDEEGTVYRVNGDIAQRRRLDRKILFQACSVQWVSDLPVAS